MYKRFIRWASLTDLADDGIIAFITNQRVILTPSRTTGSGRVSSTGIHRAVGYTFSTWVQTCARNGENIGGTTAATSLAYRIRVGVAIGTSLCAEKEPSSVQCVHPLRRRREDAELKRPAIRLSYITRR